LVDLHSPSVHSRIVKPPRPPFALDTPTFSFPALATLTGRAPLGGAREAAIVAFAAARLAEEVRAGGLSVEERQARAAAARRWLSSLSLPEPLKRAFNDLAGATERDGLGTSAQLRRVMEVTGSTLDGPARAEMERLAKELESQMIGRS
jgi:hypothetical protein